MGGLRRARAALALDSAAVAALRRVSGRTACLCLHLGAFANRSGRTLPVSPFPLLRARPVLAGSRATRAGALVDVALLDEAALVDALTVTHAATVLRIVLPVPRGVVPGDFASRSEAAMRVAVLMHVVVVVMVHTDHLATRPVE